ncbi:MAG: GTPase [Geitlerinemataceae cyanobacterium]
MNLREFLQGIAKEVLGDRRMSEEDFEKIYREIEQKIDNEPPPKFAFMGKTGVGKSSTLNALFNAGLDISHTEACTQEAKGVEISLSELSASKGSLIVFDMPGLGESRARQAQHLATYDKILRTVDVALWILDAHDREMESVQRNLEDSLHDMNPKAIEHMVIALNKVDLVHPMQWHPHANLPSEEQEDNIKRRISDVTRKVCDVIPNWNGKIIGYSAHKRYNLPQLFATMLDAVPIQRQWVVASRRAIADFLEFVHPSLLPPDRKQVKKSRESVHTPKMSEVIEQMSCEEFTRCSASKEEFSRWLKEKGL